MDPEPPPAQTASPDEIERAGAVHLFFAHQSVGQNILSGVAALSAHRIEPVPLLSLRSDQPSPAWVDMPAGQNGDPKSKVDAFVLAFEQHPTFQPALALLKFCFVDFQPATDVEDLLHYYERALRGLEQRHPQTLFAHATVPLTVYPTELKWRIFRLLGRPVWEDEANIKREAFNRRLRSTFASNPVFDLAAAESLGPDGHRALFAHGERLYPALDPRYAEDEGHLNTLGQKVVASAFLRFVVGARRRAEVSAPPATERQR